MNEKIKKIQAAYRVHRNHLQTKKKIFEIRKQKLKSYNDRQKKFREDYRRLEITAKAKYEIHISSHSIS